MEPTLPVSDQTNAEPVSTGLPFASISSAAYCIPPPTPTLAFMGEMTMDRPEVPARYSTDTVEIVERLLGLVIATWNSYTPGVDMATVQFLEAFTLSCPVGK